MHSCRFLPSSHRHSGVWPKPARLGMARGVINVVLVNFILRLQNTTGCHTGCRPTTGLTTGCIV